MKRVSKLAIIGLLLKPVNSRVVPCKVAVISQRKGFVRWLLFHTYYKHIRERMLEISFVGFMDFSVCSRDHICDNRCLRKQQPP